MDVFVKAAQEAFGDSSIDVEKLFDKMKKGELSAAKIMPLISKYYADAARKGGALDLALQSNRVAMQRLGATFQNFLAQIFQGGFGDQMTKVFNDLADIIASNGPLATGFGKFFGLVTEGFWDMVTFINNSFVLIDRVSTYYLEQLGVKGETLKDVFSWGAYALGVGIFITSVSKLFGILSKIAGLSGALAAVRGSVTAAGAAVGAGTAAAGAGAAGAAGAGGGFVGPNQPSIARTPWKMMGRFAKLGALGTAWTAGSTFYGNQIQRMSDRDADHTGEVSSWAPRMPMIPGALDVVDEWSNASRAAQAVDLATRKPTFTQPVLGANTPGTATMMKPAWMNEPLKIEVTTKVEDSQFKGMIQSEIKANDQFNFNLLMQGGPG